MRGSAVSIAVLVGLVVTVPVFTDKRLRRGRFTSVTDLTEAITTWAAHWNNDPKPFVWKATAVEIIAKVERGRAALHQIKSTTDHLAL